MPPPVDLLIRNLKPWAGLGRGEGSIDLAAAGGRFVAAEPGMAAARVIDAGGRLAVPGFVEPHIHLDKVLTAERMRTNRSGTLGEAIEILWESKRQLTPQTVTEAAVAMIESAVMHGVTRIRTHVDIDGIGGLRPLRGVVAARERCRHLVDLQIVAFPQEGILRDQGTERLMWEAMENGADVVGGMPFNEPSREASARHIAIAFEIARAFDADIDMHVDETDDPEARTLEILAEQTIANGWEGRVTAGHTCALAAYPDEYAARVIAKVKAAGLHMITNPATNLMLQGRLDAEPKRRGITRVKELLAAGINVGFGQDCIRDTFYPFGRGDLLEVAFLTAHAAHMSMPAEVEQVFAMPTVNAAKVLRVDGYALAPGAPADLVILEAGSALEAIHQQAARRWVIKAGRVVAETEVRKRLVV